MGRSHIEQAEAGRAKQNTPWPPVTLAPMLATLAAKLPADDGQWGYEFKWDGIRVLGVWDGKALRLISRNGLNLTDQYPEVSGNGSGELAGGGLGSAIGTGQRVVLDGELIAPDEQGRPSFQRLQRRLNVRPGRAASERLRAAVPVAYLLFDLLCVDDEPLVGRPYLERRERLETLQLEGENWRTPTGQIGGGRRMLAAAERVGLEGVVAKRVDSVYQPGVRSRDWLKVKVRRQQELVVVGWTEMRGSPGRLGSLLVGYHKSSTLSETHEASAPSGTTVGQRWGGWRLAGQVGSGLSEDDRQMLASVLKQIERPNTVVTDPLPVRAEKVHHVEPVLVVEVSFMEWTHSGGLRHPVFRGIRTDKNPREVVREY
ncbi:MAG: hypothetical protein WD294_00530 [Phycisphaeraceae bacterium]